MKSNPTQAPINITEAGEVLIYDPTVEQVDVLMDGLQSGIHAIPITTGDDPMDIIKQVLQNPSMARLHVLGHGAPGEVILGGQRINSDAFERRAFEPHGNKFNPLQIAFWSCNTGHGETGMNFLNTVANRTGANVYASTGLVGHEDKGGSWQLDVHATPQAPFSAQAREGFRQVLANVPVTSSMTGAEIQAAIDGLADGQYLDVDFTGMVADQLAVLASNISLVALKVGTLSLNNTLTSTQLQVLLQNAGSDADVRVDITGMTASAKFSAVADNVAYIDSLIGTLTLSSTIVGNTSWTTRLNNILTPLGDVAISPTNLTSTFQIKLDSNVSATNLQDFVSALGASGANPVLKIDVSNMSAAQVAAVVTGGSTVDGITGSLVLRAALSAANIASILTKAKSADSLLTSVSVSGALSVEQAAAIISVGMPSGIGQPSFNLTDTATAILAASTSAAVTGAGTVTATSSELNVSEAVALLYFGLWK